MVAMTSPDEVSLTPDAEPPAFMQETGVRELTDDDGTVRAYELAHPSGVTVTSASRELAESDLGEILASRAAAEADRTGHGVHPAGLGQAETGKRYAVVFEDCCVQGEFTATVTARGFGTGGAPGGSVVFDNGIILSGHGVRVEELDG